jgi:hypothetical protein
MQKYDSVISKQLSVTSDNPIKSVATCKIYAEVGISIYGLAKKCFRLELD